VCAIGILAYPCCYGRAEVPCADVVGEPPNVIHMGVTKEDMPLVTASWGAAPRVEYEVELRQDYACFLRSRLYTFSAARLCMIPAFKMGLISRQDITSSRVQI
jgi:hypothetical protein